ncbi:MAG: DUF4330 domain-containing protein [Candidatus Omnitrophota bacterium]|jgi:hypothetical protein
MKIIDEKGRLFGKINVIDFLVILFLLCLMPIFYFGCKAAFKKSAVIDGAGGFMELEINCRFAKIEPVTLVLISVGDKEFDKKNRVIGEIIWISQAKPHQYKFDMGTGTILIKEDPLLKDLDAKLKLKVEMRGSRLYYKDKQITVDSSFDFKTDKYALTAVPVI